MYYKTIRKNLATYTLNIMKGQPCQAKQGAVASYVLVVLSHYFHNVASYIIKTI